MNDPFLDFIGHVASVSAILAALAGAIPAIAALVAIVWYAILIWESATAKKWRRNHRALKLAKIRAQERLLLARIKDDGENFPTPSDPSQ